ncbi:MAG: hypothetical protein KIS78_08550 [Labilithrix sp.]|nr:hypothetical protein [Labilithrix sp.]MCW5832474.1 hypothetical protein [Labilithrix sp.]
MSDESALTQEIPLDHDDTSRETVAIDRDGEPRVSPRRGVALSVLWWEEDARLPTS